MAAGAGSEHLFRQCCNILEKHYNSTTYSLENLIKRTFEDNEFKDLAKKDGKFKIILTDGEFVYEMDKKEFRDISKSNEDTGVIIASDTLSVCNGQNVAKSSGNSNQIQQ